MPKDEVKVLIMAGGTGGHIFPAMSIAEKLVAAGARVEWLGTADGLEARIVGSSEFPLHLISVKGVRGKGLLRLLLAPLMIARATLQALGVMKKFQPDCVLGMGGFVTGPGGVAAKLSGRKLLIHEQNAVAGISNKLLALIADKIMEAFPDTFRKQKKLEYTGNPVRESIVAVGDARKTQPVSDHPMRILVLGGSQGAVAINQVIPPALALWSGDNPPQVIHQSGARNLDETIAMYSKESIQPGERLEVTGFIEDMARAFMWADLVICRSGASTVCELAVAGLPSILVPYPHHKDNQQTRNGQWLSNAGAAILIQQSQLSAQRLADELKVLDGNRSILQNMSNTARQLATPGASDVIASRCLETVNG